MYTLISLSIYIYIYIHTTTTTSNNTKNDNHNTLGQGSQARAAPPVWRTLRDRIFTSFRAILVEAVQRIAGSGVICCFRLRRSKEDGLFVIRGRRSKIGVLRRWGVSSKKSLSWKEILPSSKNSPSSFAETFVLSLKINNKYCGDLRRRRLHAKAAQKNVKGLAREIPRQYIYIYIYI